MKELYSLSKWPTNGIKKSHTRNKGEQLRLRSKTFSLNWMNNLASSISVKFRCFSNSCRQHKHRGRCCNNNERKSHVSLRKCWRQKLKNYNAAKVTLYNTSDLNNSNNESWMGKCFSTKVISSIAILAGPSTQSGPLVDTFHAKDSAISTYAIDAHAAHKTIFSRSNMGIPISLKEKKRKMTVLHVIT